MRHDLFIQPEAFEFEPFGAGTPSALQFEGGNPVDVRWVQNSLNKILGLQLETDGIMGPQTRSAIRSFQQKQGLVADGVVGPKTEAAIRTPIRKGSRISRRPPFLKQPSRQSVGIALVVPAYTQCDFIDPRIDVDAQYALYEMLKRDIATREAAVGILAAVKAGALGGVYKEDQRVPALYARSMDLGWWQLIDLGGRGRPAACVRKEGIVITKHPLTRSRPSSAPPIIVFRRNLKDRFLLGQALRQAWEACELPQLPAPEPRGTPCRRPPPPPPPPPPKEKKTNGANGKPLCEWERYDKCLKRCRPWDVCENLPMRTLQEKMKKMNCYLCRHNCWRNFCPSDTEPPFQPPQEWLQECEATRDRTLAACKYLVDPISQGLCMAEALTQFTLCKSTKNWSRSPF